MNALAGCFWRNGRPASASDLQPSMAAVRHRAREGLLVRVSGPAALAAGRIAVGGVGADAGKRAVLLAFHGRLDNREVLSRDLESSAAGDDAWFALQVFRSVGISSGALLEGDFSFAAWDPDARELVCVRDALGQRPLFYSASSELVVVGSEPQQVLAHAHVPRAINQGMIAEHLSGRISTVEETLWSGLMRLPPGHALVVSARGTRISKVWDFGPAREGRCRTDQEYAARFRELFTRAVERRATSKPAVFLSGGIDSSAVAAVAGEGAKRDRGGHVRTFSLRFPGHDCDESRFIDEVVRFCGAESERLPAAPVSLHEVRVEVDRYLDVPAYPNGSVMDPLRRRAASAGRPVVMTGYGGDEWFTGRAPHSLLRRVRGCITGVMPSPVRRGIRAMLGRGNPGADWIRPEFARRVSLEDRLRPPEPPPFDSDAQRRIYRLVRCASQVLADELEERAAAAAGIDQRHPFYDRSLAEFGFALPESQRFAGGMSKAVVRRALADLLPPGVRHRRDKAEFSSTFVDALESLGGSALFGSLLTEDAGWVDGGAVRRRYETMRSLYSRGGRSYIPWTNGLWEVAGLELWLRRAVMGDRS